MFFELEGKTYEVRFRRYGKSTTTIAEIVEISDTGVRYLGIYGLATVGKGDKYNEITGNKIALTNLMNGLWTQDGEIKPMFSKEDREIIWKAFFEEFKR